MPKIIISNQDILNIRDSIGKDATPEQISNLLNATYKTSATPRYIKGRLQMIGKPIDKPIVDVEAKTVIVSEFNKQLPNRIFNVHPSMLPYVPKDNDYSWYIERDVDTRLNYHYMLGKHPLTQGKQGTGKTASHGYFAYKHKLPFFLYSLYEDFRLPKLFGDKTIVNGNIEFKESLFTFAIQNPCVICFDEINALSQANTYDFHALLQNRELFIKDADNGLGKTYKVHPDCFIGFAQNPKSAKYIGGNIRSSNFLGRCTFITYPEFTTPQLKQAITKRHVLPKDTLNKFVAFYKGCLKAIEESQLPLDISIRQLINVIDLYVYGLDLRTACEDGLASMADAASQPKAKEALMIIAESTWEELLKKEEQTTETTEERDN